MIQIKRFKEKNNMNTKVFLGGTCNNSTWREDLIKLLKVTYFNPIVDDWNEEAQKEEIKQRKNCAYCLYIITPKMKGVYSIAEVVDDSNKQLQKTLFCILEKDGKDKFDESQLKSLKQVNEMIKKNKGKIFNNLQEIADFLNKGK